MVSRAVIATLVTQKGTRNYFGQQHRTLLFAAICPRDIHSAIGVQLEVIASQTRLTAVWICGDFTRDLG